MRIRKAIKGDKEAFSELYHQLYSDNENKKSGLIPIEQSNFKNILLIAEDNEEMIGFIWANFISFGFSRYGYVEDLYVKSEHRKKGIATSLISALKDKFKELNVEAVFITTEKENKEAINFFSKEGFNLCPGPWFYWDPSS